MKSINWHIQKAQQPPTRRNWESHTKTPHNQTVKSKRQWDNLKAAKEKQLITYKRSSIRLKADLSWKITTGRKQWHDLFKMPKAETVNQEFYVGQNYPSHVKEQLRHFQINKNRDIAGSKPILQKQNKAKRSPSGWNKTHSTDAKTHMPLCPSPHQALWTNKGQKEETLSVTQTLAKMTARKNMDGAATFWRSWTAVRAHPAAPDNQDWRLQATLRQGGGVLRQSPHQKLEMAAGLPWILQRRKRRGTTKCKEERKRARLFQLEARGRPFSTKRKTRGRAPKTGEIL